MTNILLKALTDKQRDAWHRQTGPWPAGEGEIAFHLLQLLKRRPDRCSAEESEAAQSLPRSTSSGQAGVERFARE